MAKPKTVLMFAVSFLVCLGLKGVSAEDQPDSDPIAKDIQAGVKALEYPEQVGQDLAKIAETFKCVEWKQRISQAKENLLEKKITADQVSQIEEQVAKELFQTIGKEFLNIERTFSLRDLGLVLIHKRDNSCSFTQLFSILGESVGLNVKVVYAFEPDSDNVIIAPFPQHHINAGVNLSNGKMVVFDVACNYASKQFSVNEEFKEAGTYLEAKDKSPLGIHNRIQFWDKNGLLASIYFLQGSEALMQKKNKEAISLFDKAIQLNPAYALPYVNRGATYDIDFNLGQAIADFNKAVELNPKAADSYIRLGSTYFRMNKRAEALSAFNKVIELYPESSMAYVKRANIFLQMQKISEGAADAQKATEKDPKNVKALFAKASANFLSGKYDEACSDIGRIIELDPKNEGAYSFRADVYFTNKKYAEAADDFSKVIEINPTQGDAYYGRGCMYAKLKKIEEAKKDLRQALKLDKSLEENIRIFSDKYGLDLFAPVM